MKTNSFFLVGILSALLLVAFALPQQSGDPWEVPAKYQNMENPVKKSSQVLATGKMLYDKHCKSCHGKEGLGDGPKAAQLDTPSGDFTSDDFKEQSDGSIFYKTKTGRDDMPSFEKKIPYDEDIWSIVHYVRTME